MLYKEDVKMRRLPGEQKEAVKPPHCEEFKACLKQAMKVLEDRYKV